jgi:hypothetical protein
MTWLWWYWPLALAFIAFVLFGIPEYAAIRFGGPTFSRFMATVANAGAGGKIWCIAWGMLIGGLIVHFTGWCMYVCDGKLTGG